MLKIVVAYFKKIHWSTFWLLVASCSGFPELLAGGGL